MRRIPFILLIFLVGTASAVPLLPAEFSGAVTIDGSPAPAGTIITARIDGRDCGSLTLETAGVYGGDATFDKRLLVCGGDDDVGKTITFFVDGVKATGTAVYTPGTSTRLDLAVTSGADFSADVTAGPAPLTVRFSGGGTGNPKSWSWAFGDGGSATVQNPEYTYRNPGNYTVNLTVSTGTGSAALSRPGYITVTAPKGDVTGDGKVDIGDVARVAYMVVGKEAAEPAADFNGNGVVDIGDAAKIAYYFVEKIEAL
ncbi:PKD domain-containing protein [Methanoculleus bourgensis]|uniref:PKD domain-containing protein n=1 Tax=Methanoculleus bourgensis TaxID=83986 RepID=UPI003B926502